MKSLVVINPEFTEMVFGEEELDRIGTITELLHPPMSTEELFEHEELLEHAEVIFAGWGGPVVDNKLLSLAPNLRLYLYAAGTPDAVVTPECADSDVTVCSTVEANSFVVAEYILAFILLGLKRVHPLAKEIRIRKGFPSMAENTFTGNYRSVVGMVAMGRIARKLIKLLEHHDHRVIGHDPYVDPVWAEDARVRLVDLDEVFSKSDAVSIHLPATRANRKLVTGRHIRMMKKNAVFINTSRGMVLDEESVLDALEEREDIFAVFDVTYPVPPKPSSRFYTLKNILLTPHIAGSLFGECRRLADMMIDDCERFMAGRPTVHTVDAQRRHSRLS